MQFSRVGSNKVTEVEVREYGPEHFSNFLRFMHTIPYGVQRHLNSWEAVIKHVVPLENNVFGNQKPPNRRVENMISSIKTLILQNCLVLTVG